ncbi:Trimethylamine methyltransferase (MTTB) [Sporomusa ovata DSM 2662]|uniref:trimethylamine methyltransferase family protein n=1 Tax=Sporomusa ovata TaxID=2378 RepID=UPI0003884F71|nr:trimethylamine methyltransferase family protein [Sporomusa ovata]EQB25184.1 trimethylamine:corrinoid methyltransferase [Sporomusa ovata DSM 2662]
MNTTRSRYTRANYAVNQTTAWEMLSEDQSEELFMTTLEVLERTGVEILNQEARGIFEKAGCWVDGNRVRIPSAVTEMAVKNTPSRVTVCDRNGKRALKLETTNAYYGPGQGNVYVLDPMTSDWRKPVKEDVAKTAIVCDGLQNIDFVMNNGLPTDVNASTAEVHAFEALITNTTKPIIQAIPGVKQAQAILDIAAAVAGSLREFQKILLLYF